jgi:hypothetical protein
VVLARKEFGKKLTVMFSLEAAVDERDDSEIFEKNRRKRSFYREWNSGAKNLNSLGFNKFQRNAK